MSRKGWKRTDLGELQAVLSHLRERDYAHSITVDADGEILIRWYGCFNDGTTSVVIPRKLAEKLYVAVSDLVAGALEKYQAKIEAKQAHE